MPGNPPEEYRWKKGQSGNPKGRPKKVTFEKLVNDVLDELVPNHGITKREALAQLFVTQLLSLDNAAPFKEYVKRAWPVITQLDLAGSLEINDEREAPVIPADADRLRQVSDVLVEIGALPPGERSDAEH